MNQDERLEDLYSKYQKDPHFQHLRDQPSTFFVGGDGPLNPDLMLIGEAPGRLENANRMPFIGRAGTNLTNILTDLDIDPYFTYRTNIVKYWPRDSNGKTRPPTEQEIENSVLYLRKEIDIVKPKLVGLLGYSAITALYPNIPDVHHSHAKLLDDKYVPLYHPATYTWNVSKKTIVKSGYRQLKEYLGDLSGHSSSSGSTVK